MGIQMAWEGDKRAGRVGEQPGRGGGPDPQPPEAHSARPVAPCPPQTPQCQPHGDPQARGKLRVLVVTSLGRGPSPWPGLRQGGVQEAHPPGTPGPFLQGWLSGGEAGGLQPACPAEPGAALPADPE